MKKPLEGLNVLGLLYAGVGPMTCQFLGEYGAKVVRIESLARPDNLRISAPFQGGKVDINRSGSFPWFNNDRDSLALNMKHPRAKEVTVRLAKWADVIVENFTPGVVNSWGLGYEAVKALNPDIIMVSLSQVGQTGPKRSLPGYGPQLQGFAGFDYITGWPDRPPVLVARSYPDFVGPRFGAIAVMAALDYRRRTGKGQYIDCSEYEDCLHFLAPIFLDYSANKHITVRHGNRSDTHCPHNVYRCQGEDRWCAVDVTTEEEWAAFCQAIGQVALAKDAKFKDLASRKKNEEYLDKIIEAWTSQHTAEDVMQILQKVGIAAGTVRTPKEIASCPQLKHRHYFWTLKHQEMGDIVNPGQSSILSKSPYELKKAAPCLGADTEHVCKDLLGLTEEEYVSLLLDRIFE